MAARGAPWGVHFKTRQSTTPGIEIPKAPHRLKGHSANLKCPIGVFLRRTVPPHGEPPASRAAVATVNTDDTRCSHPGNSPEIGCCVAGMTPPLTPSLKLTLPTALPGHTWSGFFLPCPRRCVCSKDHKSLFNLSTQEIRLSPIRIALQTAGILINHCLRLY